MKRTIRMLGITFLLLIGFQEAVENLKLAHAASLANPQAAVEVKIDNFSFSPAMLEVKPGTKVTWTNADDIPHTVVSTDQVFKSKVLDTDEKYSFTFDKPGTFSYFCSLHPKMTAKVMVQ